MNNHLSDSLDILLRMTRRHREVMRAEYRKIERLIDTIAADQKKILENLESIINNK